MFKRLLKKHFLSCIKVFAVYFLIISVVSRVCVNRTKLWLCAWLWATIFIIFPGALLSNTDQYTKKDRGMTQG